MDRNRPVDRNRPTPLLVALTLLVSTALLALVAPIGASASTEGDIGFHDDPVAVADFVADINEARRIVGVGPLTVLPQLSAGAQEWTEEMFEASRLSHDPNPTTDLTVPWDMFGENVGVGNTVPKLWAAFVNSPDHLANIVKPEYTHLGVAVIVDDLGRMWTTHRFLHVVTLPPTTVPPPPPPTLPPEITVVLTPPTAPPAPYVPAPPVTAPPVTAPAVSPAASPAQSLVSGVAGGTSGAAGALAPAPVRSRVAGSPSADAGRVGAVLAALDELPA